MPSAKAALTILSVSVIVGFSASAQEGSGAAPAAQTVQAPQAVREINQGPLQLSADPPALDLGFLPPNTNGRGTITLKNIGTDPLTITSAAATCKCTTLSQLGGTVLAPGESAKLEVELDGAPALGARSSSVKVIVQGFSRILEIPVRGEVAMAVRTVPPYINAVGGKNLRGRLVVESIDKLPFTICSVDGKPPKFLGFDPAKDQPKPSYLLAYDLSEYAEGQTPRFWVIGTDHPNAPVVDVRVRHDGTSFQPVFRMKDFRMNLGAINQGSSVDATVEATDLGGPFLAASSASSDASVELLNATVEGNVSKATVRITPRGDASGVLYFPLILAASKGTQEVDCFAMVRPSGAGGCPPQNMQRTFSSDSRTAAEGTAAGDSAAAPRRVPSRSNSGR